MRNEILRAEIEKLAITVVEPQGLDLVELTCWYAGRNLMVRILVDKFGGGITVGECAQLNRQICMMLDEKDLIQERYILEVSSPGIDRPLKTKKDFSRCLKSDVRFFLHEPLSGKLEFLGVVLNVKDESVEIVTENGVVEIAFAKIAKAKRLIQ